ncbi:MAG TPA: pyridoxal-phosphate dependent enzyme [Anaerolineales bacterium]|nr:pyridoxal-phosphate dependent enzyme [Anaerolineales bacterium]
MRPIDPREAEVRLRGRVAETPLVAWPAQGMWLKCENQQIGGSFKLRGALNKILGLSPDALRRGLVAASAGNHGIGCAVAASAVGANLVVVVPGDVVDRKRRTLERLGAEVRLADGDFAVAEALGHRLAAETGATWVSPYNDADVVAGQGTLGLELARQLPGAVRGRALEVFVPVSGGGLLAGVALGLREAGVHARVIGVQTEAAPYMYEFFRGRDVKAVVETPTLADGLAGAVESGSITWDLVKKLADDLVLVSEIELAEWLRAIYREFGMLVEPSAAVAAAAASRGRGEIRVAVLSGGNANPDILGRLKEGGS